MARRITIRTNILTNLLAVVTVVAVALLALQYYYAKTLVVDATEKRFRLMGDKVLAKIHGRDRVIRQSLEILAMNERLLHFDVGENPRTAVRLLSSPMIKHPNLYAVYLGYPGGELFEVVNLSSADRLKTFYKTPADARWLLIRVFEAPGGRWVRRFDAYGGDYGHLDSWEESSDYRVLERPWYRQALGKGTVVRSDPYLFYNLQQTGITYSLETERAGVVLALDTTTHEMDRIFRQLKFAPRSEVVMLGQDLKVIASSEGRHGEASHGIYRQLIARGATGKIVAYEREGERYLAMVIPFVQDGGASPWWLGLSIDEATMIGPYMEVLTRELAVAMLILLLMLPVVRFTTRRIVEPIHALMRENEKVRQRRFDEVERIETEIIELDQLSRSLVEMSESIREYQESQKRLLDAFIRLIAEAIDAKSPYTGGHCKRVPLIAERLLQEAHRSREGELADFRLEGAEAWEEFERGAWLHDCGKITTPEYVVDKATKLETIHNRIHEVRTRFEVLWRDAEIRYYEGLLAGDAREKLERELRREHAALLEEFDFIARVNIGGEFLDAESRERVERIARRTWLRHFDDRLGLSEAERQRMERVPVRPLPAEERLLDDRPEHRIERTDFDREAYEKAGFTMPVPELLYNRGEVYNLTIERGTLTPEERFKINEHVIQTLRMLQQLPLPENMKRIPEYAGTHHEQMNGGGYPRSLKAEELSIPARVMAIADIFEALTASDRPYKKGKKLSVALKIMAGMARDGHIDSRLFGLFVRSELYREYAQKYLRPEQLDRVDVEAILEGLPGGEG
jgi:HD-GYP domain-containing protein (c-di-GMP phosphodiesterase class II)